MQYYKASHQREMFAVLSVENCWGVFCQLKVLVKIFGIKHRICLFFLVLTLNVPSISESCIEIKLS